MLLSVVHISVRQSRRGFHDTNGEVGSVIQMNSIAGINYGVGHDVHLCMYAREGMESIDLMMGIKMEQVCLEKKAKKIKI